MRTQVVGPPDDDFHHFPRCVFLVFVSVVHLRFMLQFFFHIRFAHTRLGFFPTRPDIKLCYAGCFAKRAQSGVARQVLHSRVGQPCQIPKSNPGEDFPTLTVPQPRLRRRPLPPPTQSTQLNSTQFNSTQFNSTHPSSQKASAVSDAKSRSVHFHFCFYSIPAPKEDLQ